jgi:hypothetical protein
MNGKWVVCFASGNLPSTRASSGAVPDQYEYYSVLNDLFGTDGRCLVKVRFAALERSVEERFAFNADGQYS